MKRLPLSETVKKSKIKFYATHFLRAKSPPCHRPSIAPAFIFQRFRRSSSTAATKKPVKLTPRHSTAALDEDMAKYAYAPLSVVSFASPCCATAALGRSLPPTHALGHCRKMTWAKSRLTKGWKISLIAGLWLALVRYECTCHALYMPIPSNLKASSHKLSSSFVIFFARAHRLSKTFYWLGLVALLLVLAETNQ